MSILGAKMTMMRLPLMLVAVSALIGGCSYDYAQRSDRVAFNAGNAVKANLEMQTRDPSKKTMNRTSDLGKNGSVIPDAAASTTP